MVGLKIYTQADLARMFNVSDSQISYLKRIGKIVPVITAKKSGVKHIYNEAAVLSLEKYFAERREIKGYCNSGHKYSKCWSCLKSYNGCSWSREQKPVPGWVAVKVDIKLHGNREAYIVQKCPEYEKEVWILTPYGTLVRKNPVPDEWKVKPDAGFDALNEAISKKPFKS